MRRDLARVVLSVGVVIASTLIGLGTVEVALRLVRPDLGNAAHGSFEFSRNRLRQTVKDSVGWATQPDTGVRHRLICNSLGSRQHREFSATKKPGVLRIGVFGDSFTENSRLPVQYSFTEPLDYLLNSMGRPVEVLNFGCDDYGTDQAYLWYMDEGPRLGLDVVIYMYCANDLSDLMGNDLFVWDATRGLTYMPRAESPWYVKVARPFYLTYFVMERAPGLADRMATLLYVASGLESERHGYWTHGAARDRRGDVADRNEDLLESSVPAAQEVRRVFFALVDAMKSDVEQRGGKFIVGIVPVSVEATHTRLERMLRERGIDVVDLQPWFDGAPPPAPRFQFERDAHWNEEGNKFAAFFLARFLADRLGWRAPSDAFLGQKLFEYYQSFPPTAVGPALLEPVPVAPALAGGIARKYLSLENQQIPRGAPDAARD